MATAGEDKVVTIWDFQETRIAFELRGHATGVTSVAFSPDGKALASAAHDGSLRIWDVRTGQLRLTLTLGTGDIRSIAYSPDASLLATASSDRSVRLWDTNSGSLVKKLTGHSAAVNAVAFSPDGNTLATASSDKTIRLWDVRTGGLFQTLSGHTEPVLAVQFSPDDRIVASAGARLALSHHGELKFWSAQTGREVLSPPFHSPTSALTFRPDGKALALACYGSDRLWNILILDLRDGRPLRHYVAHSRRITQLAYSPDGSWLASVSFDKSIRAWH